MFVSLFLVFLCFANINIFAGNHTLFGTVSFLYEKSASPFVERNEILTIFASPILRKKRSWTGKIHIKQGKNNGKYREIVKNTY